MNLGFSSFGRGFKILATQPRLFLLGMVPPLVMSAVLVAGWVLLGMQVWNVSGWILPESVGGGVLQVVVAIAITVGVVLLSVMAYSTLTLTLGAPVYDVISAGVDRQLGPVPDETHEPVARMVVRVIGQAVLTLFLTLCGAVVCFLIGLVPIIGGVVGVVASVAFGGYMVARELIGPTCERRGLMSLAQRRRLLLQNWRAALAFGIPAYWLISIPIVSVVVFPAMVAGATVLTRNLLEPGEQRP